MTKPNESERCKQCGGSKSAYADNYFIKKCYCDELDDLEGDREDEEDY